MATGLPTFQPLQYEMDSQPYRAKPTDIGSSFQKPRAPRLDRSCRPDPKQHGHINGALPGQTCSSRAELSQAGLHASYQSGISGSTHDEGAASVVMSGGYPDGDGGDIIWYLGSGGYRCPTSHKKSSRMVTSQSLNSFGNKALSRSLQTGQPVRVIRGPDVRHSPWAPASGYRYDGLYIVTRFGKITDPSGLTPFDCLEWRMERVLDEDAEYQVPIRPGKEVQAAALAAQAELRKAQEDSDDLRSGNSIAKQHEELLALTPSTSSTSNYPTRSTRLSEQNLTGPNKASDPPSCQAVPSNSPDWLKQSKLQVLLGGIKIKKRKRDDSYEEHGAQTAQRGPRSESPPALPAESMIRPRLNINGPRQDSHQPDGSKSPPALPTDNMIQSPPGSLGSSPMALSKSSDLSLARDRGDSSRPDRSMSPPALPIENMIQSHPDSFSSRPRSLSMSSDFGPIRGQERCQGSDGLDYNPQDRAPGALAAHAVVISSSNPVSFDASALTSAPNLRPPPPLHGDEPDNLNNNPRDYLSNSPSTSPKSHRKSSICLGSSSLSEMSIHSDSFHAHHTAKLKEINTKLPEYLSSPPQLALKNPNPSRPDSPSLFDKSIASDFCHADQHHLDEAKNLDTDSHGHSSRSPPALPPLDLAEPPISPPFSSQPVVKPESSPTSYFCDKSRAPPKSPSAVPVSLLFSSKPNIKYESSPIMSPSPPALPATPLLSSKPTIQPESSPTTHSFDQESQLLRSPLTLLVSPALSDKPIIKPDSSLTTCLIDPEDALPRSPPALFPTDERYSSPCAAFVTPLRKADQPLRLQSGSSKSPSRSPPALPPTDLVESCIGAISPSFSSMSIDSCFFPSQRPSWTTIETEASSSRMDSSTCDLPFSGDQCPLGTCPISASSTCAYLPRSDLSHRSSSPNCSNEAVEVKVDRDLLGCRNDPRSDVELLMIKEDSLTTSAWLELFKEEDQMMVLDQEIEEMVSSSKFEWDEIRHQALKDEFDGYQIQHDPKTNKYFVGGYELVD